MSLNYLPFAASEQMRNAVRNNPVLKYGSSGLAVGLLQGALIDLGYSLPKSTAKMGAPDGIFGEETRAAVQAFQASPAAGKLTADGKAGKLTIEKLDGLMVARSAPKVPKPPPSPPKPRQPPPPPSSDSYQLGRGDPAYKPDPGAGRWGSKPVEGSYLASKAGIVAGLPGAAGIIGLDAARHMGQFFSNTGAPLSILKVARMLSDVPTALERYKAEVAQAKAFVEQLSPGRHQITSRQVESGNNPKDESWNWFYAIGGYASWGRGEAIVPQFPHGDYRLNFEYVVRDRYNWDTGKAVDILGIEITDEFMGEFHRQGIAKEFDCWGIMKAVFIWKRGKPIPAAQLVPR